MKIKLKKIQVGLLILFLGLCFVSTIMTRNYIAPQITNDLIESKDTTLLYYIWSQEIYDGVNPVSILPQVILISKFFSIAAFFFIEIYFMVKQRGYRSILDWVYLLLSGFIFSVHFASFEIGPDYIVLLRKFYVAYYVGITSYPLVLYYATVLLIAALMVLLLLLELRAIKNPILISDK